jgi:hypothetical protein
VGERVLDSGRDGVAPSVSGEVAEGDANGVREAYGNWLFGRLPDWVLDSLTTEQKDAIHEVLTDPTHNRPPVNIRLSVPFLKWRFFVTVFGGEEKRNATRRSRERHLYPLRTLANVFFVVGMITLFYVIAIFALALHTAIIEI